MRAVYNSHYGLLNARAIGRKGNYITFLYIVPPSHPGYAAWYARVKWLGLSKLRPYGRPQRGKLSVHVDKVGPVLCYYR